MNYETRRYCKICRTCHGEYDDVIPNCYLIEADREREETQKWRERNFPRSRRPQERDEYTYEPMQDEVDDPFFPIGDLM